MPVHVRRRGILLGAVASLSLLLSVLLPSSTVFASSRSSRAFSSQGSATPSPPDIIARAQTWVDANPPVGYSQTPPYYPDPISGYRRDCSGYVSMAWQLPSPGLTTETLPDVADVIKPNDLRPGDVLNNRDGERNGKFAHVVIFAGWANGAHTAYHAYEENGDSGAIFVPEMPYAYWPKNLLGQPNYLSPQDYVPLRLDPSKVSSGKPPLSTPSSIRPGGLWISPIAGQTVSDPVHFSAWAYPTHAFDPTITFVRFTVAAQGSWRVACTAPPPTTPLAPVPTPAATPLPAPNAQQFSCNANLGSLGIASGPIQVSFDVYDQASNVNLAPNGIRTLTYSPSPDAACRAIAGFAQAGPAGPLAYQIITRPELGEPTVSFPPNTLGYVVRTFSDPEVGNPGFAFKFEILAVCSPAITPDAVRSFFTAHMPSGGWSQSSTFPYGGNRDSPCGDPYCWAWYVFAGEGAEFASLETVRQVGSVTIYHVRLGNYGPTTTGG